MEDELHKLRKLEKQSAYEAGTVADSFTGLFAFAALVQWNPYPSFLYAVSSCQYHSFNVVCINGTFEAFLLLLFAHICHFLPAGPSET